MDKDLGTLSTDVGAEGSAWDAESLRTWSARPHVLAFTNEGS